jgi:hypothetical protein
MFGIYLVAVGSHRRLREDNIKVDVKDKRGGARFIWLKTETFAWLL